MKKNIRKVVIPIAGYGSRMFPVTLGITKAMLPLVDRPVIEYLVEECVKAGIYEIIIIMSRNQMAVKDYLLLNDQETLNKFAEKKEVITLKELLSKVKFTFIVQASQKGLGDAILCAKDAVGDEDFGVILGDNPILVKEDIPFGIGQLCASYNDNQGYYIGVKKVSQEETKKYGIVDAISTIGETFKLKGMIEKPISNPPSEYAALGRYILKNSIFDYLQKTTIGFGGELQLTDAIKTAIENEDVYGIKLMGTCHDTGCRAGFIKANIDYASVREDIKEELTK